MVFDASGTPIWGLPVTLTTTPNPYDYPGCLPTVYHGVPACGPASAYFLNASGGWSLSQVTLTTTTAQDPAPDLVYFRESFNGGAVTFTAIPNCNTGFPGGYGSYPYSMNATAAGNSWSWFVGATYVNLPTPPWFAACNPQWPTGIETPFF